MRNLTFIILVVVLTFVTITTIDAYVYAEKSDFVLEMNNASTEHEKLTLCN